MFLAKLDVELEQLSRNNKKVIVMGDFNTDTLPDDLVTNYFAEVVISNGFQFSISSPTRIGVSSETCIGHIITSDVEFEKARS